MPKRVVLGNARHASARIVRLGSRPLLCMQQTPNQRCLAELVFLPQTNTKFCILIQGVDNLEQASLRPSAVFSDRSRYSPSLVSMRWLATFGTAGFREELFSVISV